MRMHPIHAALTSVLLLASVSVADTPRTLTALIHTPGPRWDADVGFRNQSGIRNHIKYFDALLEKGTLWAGGPFVDDSGGLMLIRTSVEGGRAAAIAYGDPAVDTGLLGVRIAPLTVQHGSAVALIEGYRNPDVRSVELRPALGEDAPDAEAGDVVFRFVDGSGWLIVRMHDATEADSTDTTTHPWLLVFKHRDTP